MVDINATLIAQVLNFLVLVFILAKFAYKPLVNKMEERKDKIANDLEFAEKAKIEAEKIKAEYAEKLASIRQDANEIIENARKTAQAVHDKTMEETKAEQDQVIAAAKESIEIEKQQALSDVRAQVIKLSLIVAGKIVEQKLGSEEDQKIAGNIADAVLKE